MRGGRDRHWCRRRRPRSGSRVRRSRGPRRRPRRPPRPRSWCTCARPPQLSGHPRASTSACRRSAPAPAWSVSPQAKKPARLILPLTRTVLGRPPASVSPHCRDQISGGASQGSLREPAHGGREWRGRTGTCTRGSGRPTRARSGPRRLRRSRSPRSCSPAPPPPPARPSGARVHTPSFAHKRPASACPPPPPDSRKQGPRRGYKNTEKTAASGPHAQADGGKRPGRPNSGAMPTPSWAAAPVVVLAHERAHALAQARAATSKRASALSQPTTPSAASRQSRSYHVRCPARPRITGMGPARAERQPDEIKHTAAAAAAAVGDKPAPLQRLGCRHCGCSPDAGAPGPPQGGPAVRTADRWAMCSAHGFRCKRFLRVTVGLTCAAE